MARILVGTCGFQKARRRHYSSLDAVEVQQTFYDPRPGERFAAWRSEAPEGFEFTVKVWMLVTHGYNRMLWRRLKSPVPFDASEFQPFGVNRATLWALEETLKAAEALKARILVFQTPASFRATEENAARIAAFSKEAGLEGYTLVWEPRGDWWERRDFLAETARRAGFLVDGDALRGRLPPEGQDFLYTRLHGLGGREVNYRYKYTDEDLDRLLGIVAGYRVAYVMFNNVYAFEDAVRFKRLVSSKPPGAPAGR